MFNKTFFSKFGNKNNSKSSDKIIDKFDVINSYLISISTLISKYEILKNLSQYISTNLDKYSGSLSFKMHSNDSMQIFAVWESPTNIFEISDTTPFSAKNEKDTAIIKKICSEAAKSEVSFPIKIHSNTYAELRLWPNSASSKTIIEEDYIDIVNAITKITQLSLAANTKQSTAENISLRDPLTGLFNKNYLMDTMEREIHHATRKKHSLGIIQYDIDDFNLINKNYGYEAGNKLLIAFAGIMQATFRGHDITCRMKDNRIIQILPEASIKNTLIKAEDVNKWINELSVKYKNHTLPAITVSIGIAAFPDHGENSDELIQAVDSALYRSKRAGKDQITIAEKFQC